MIYGIRSLWVPLCGAHKLLIVYTRIMWLSRDGRLKKYRNKNGRDNRQNASLHYSFKQQGFRKKSLRDASYPLSLQFLFLCFILLSLLSQAILFILLYYLLNNNEALSCKTLCALLANKPEHAETVLLNSGVVHAYHSYRSRVTTRMQCSCGITCYYVIATNHVCAKSAELVQTKSRSLAESTVLSDESVKL